MSQSAVKQDWVVLAVDSDVLIQPRAASLAGGLLDVCIHLLDFDAAYRGIAKLAKT